MKTWTCPSCGESVKARGTQVTHRCPKRQNKFVDFVPDMNDLVARGKTAQDRD